MPVAKRNFIRRHGHGLITSTKALKETVDNARIKFVERTGCLPVDTPFTPMISMVSAELEQLRCRAVSPSMEGGDWAAAPSSGGVLQQLLPEAHQGPRSSSDTSEYSTMHQLSTEEQQWLSLLRSRPVIDDPASMMTWLGHVLGQANVLSRAEEDAFESMPDVSDDDLEESLNVLFASDDISQCPQSV